jgi:hypothetical protein
VLASVQMPQTVALTGVDLQDKQVNLLEIGGQFSQRGLGRNSALTLILVRAGSGLQNAGSGWARAFCRPGCLFSKIGLGFY